jgi:hypothetical protein
MANPVVFTKQLAAADDDGIAASQTPGSAALTLNGAAVVSGIAIIDTQSAANQMIGRRVIVTSGGNDSGITWTVVGTSTSGAQITDTFAGASGGAAQSNLDFVTVRSITPSGAVATTAKAGTNGVGSTPWQVLNWQGYSPMNVSVAVELVSGAANFTIQHTYDDPNNLLAGLLAPLAFNSPLINAASATIEGAYTTPILAVRLLINSGTGELRTRILQAGIG